MKRIDTTGTAAEGLHQVTDTSEYTFAIWDFEGGKIGRSEFMSRLLAIGLPADAIRWHIANPGRGMVVFDVA